MKAICPVCENEFEKSHGLQKYCSRECRWEAAKSNDYFIMRKFQGNREVRISDDEFRKRKRIRERIKEKEA